MRTPPPRRRTPRETRTERRSASSTSGSRRTDCEPEVIRSRAMGKVRRRDALEYHTQGRPGKIEVRPTKPLTSQRDLSLAYSPGVAEPCLEIAADPEKADRKSTRLNSSHSQIS